MPKERAQSQIRHYNYPCQHTVFMYLMRLCQRCEWKFSVILRGQVDACVAVLEEKERSPFSCLLSLIGSALGFPQTSALDSLLVTGMGFQQRLTSYCNSFRTGVHSPLVCSNLQV